MHAGSGRRLLLTLAAVALLARLGACDSPTKAVVGDVRVAPDSTDVVVGEETRLTATVFDDGGGEVGDPSLAWTSKDPSVATVDETGMVTGKTPGTATIEVAAEGVTGSGRIRVLPPPSVALSTASVVFAVGAGAPAPEPSTVQVSNGGAGSIGSLAAQVFHQPGATPWLSAALAGSAAPTSVTLTVDPEGVTAGEHRATVRIASSEAGVAPGEIAVRLVLTDVRLEETDGDTEVSEAAGTDRVRVALAVAPSEDVVLEVASDEDVLTVSPTRLTFTHEGWSVPQEVTVTGVEDATVNGTRTSEITIRVDASASDPAFAGVSGHAVPVTVLDDDVAGMGMSATGGSTRVDEGGGTDEVHVVLTAGPLTDVQVVLSVDDGTEVSLSPRRLTFTPEDWSTPQAVTVRGVDDVVADGPQESEITARVDPAASDDAFDDVEERTLGVRTDDDDLAGLVLVESGGSTYVDEGGASDQVSVRLTVLPAGTVVVAATVDDPTEATVAPAALTFTPADWDTPQLVTLTGVDDAEMDGAVISTLTLAVDAASSDPDFGSVPPEQVAVVTADDEAVGVSQATPTSHPAVSADALVAAYDFTTLTAEGLLRDFSGRDLHGAISGTEVIATPRGGGRRFQIATDRIELPPRADFDLDGPLTIVTRMRLDVRRRHQHIIACDDKFALAIREADQVRLSNSRGDLGETLEPLSADVWHSVIAVFRGTVGDVMSSANVEIWVDGVSRLIRVQNATGTSPVIWRDGVLHSSDACYIGFESHQGSPGHQNLAFHGALDELLVFGRALTHEEILLLAAP